MADAFHCSLVTPEEKLIDEEVTYAMIPAWDGGIGIEVNHAPLLLQIGVGSLRLDFPSGASRWYLLEGGFAQVVGNKLTMLSNRATPAERLVVSDAEKELSAALEMTATDDASFKVKERAIEVAREKKQLASLIAQRGI